MDPCRTGANVANSRAMIRSNLGVPRAYANKMSVNNICTAFKNCQKTNILPPMDLHTVGNHTYLIDPRSPISVNDYVVLFGKGDLKRIAKKVGLVHLGLSRNIIKAGIIDVLKSLHICEPIELPTKRTPSLTPKNSVGNMNLTGNLGGNTGNFGGNLGNTGNNRNRVNSSGNTGNTGNMNLGGNPGNTGNRLNNLGTPNMYNSFSSNGMPPMSTKRFIVHPSKFRQSNSSKNERIRELIKKYHYNRNPRYIRNYSPNSNDEFNMFKHILNNDSINNNKKFFKIRNRVKVPSPKKEVEPNRSKEIEELTKTVKNISNQIGKPTGA